MIKEYPPVSAEHLISVPDNYKPGALPTLMVTWTVDEIFGGMTKMCLDRAHIFHERGVPSAVVTFAPNPDFEVTRRALVEAGKLNANVPIVNLHEYYAQHFPEDAASGFKASDLDGFQWIAAEEIHRSDDQSLLSRDFTIDAEPELRCREYYRRDGSRYMVDCTLPQLNDSSKKRRVLQLFGPDGSPVAEFPSAAKLYRHWLSEIIGYADTNLIVDSKYSAAFLGVWKHPSAVRLYAFHSTHVAPRQNLLTGKLTKSHGPIIEQRHEWDGLVFLTKSQRDAFTRRFGNATNSFVIGNPTEGPASYPPAAERDPKKVVYVGRLSAGKNVNEVIDIVHLLVQSGEAVTLDIIGDGVQRDALERQVRDLGLEGTVNFLGHISSVAQHLQKATVLLLCSSYEGQSLVMLEAQANGCIPVTYDVDFGPRDVIEDGVSGYLVPFGEKDSAAETVSQLLKDENLRARISLEAFNRAVNFNNESTFNRWQQALGDTRRSRQVAQMLATVKPVLEGIRFCADGNLELMLAWDGLQLEFDAMELLVAPRGAAGLDTQAVLEASAIGNGTATFTIPGNIRTNTDSKEPLDLSVRLRSGDASAILRLGVPKGHSLSPYLTAYGNLSIK
ncbi:glycosyltransferase [Glutamicibacter arilaitensis]|uniref:glycosyltransferase n=1 Tax=Glutamicibacter arilaitensis TaxID=256701 RepID=UPI00384D74D3